MIQLWYVEAIGTDTIMRANERFCVLVCGQVEKVLLDQKTVDTAAVKMEELVNMLIAKNTMKHIAGKTKYLDIVKDVLNVAPIHWIANEIVSPRPSADCLWC